MSAPSRSAEAGGYGEGAQPAIPPGLLDEGRSKVDMAVHYNLSDGVYSAGVRNNVPEPVIREAIQLLGKLDRPEGAAAGRRRFSLCSSRAIFAANRNSPARCSMSG